MDEQALIGRAKQGDEAAWRTIHQEHGSRVFSIAWNCSGGDADTADDLSQEIWVRLVKKLPQFQFRSAFKTWLTKVAYSAAYDYLRRYKKKGERRVEEWEPDDVSGDDPPFDEALLDGMTVQSALEKLARGAPRYALAFDMWRRGYSDEEIAETLKVTRGTVRSLRFRALALARRIVGLEGARR